VSDTRCAGKVKRGVVRGHSAVWDGERWLTADGADADRLPCTHCGRVAQDERGPAPCLGALPGVSSACCGHGERKRAWIVFASGVVVRGFTVTWPREGGK